MQNWGSIIKGWQIGALVLFGALLAAFIVDDSIGAVNMAPIPLTETEKLQLENLALKREILIFQIRRIDSQTVTVTDGIFTRAGVSTEDYNISLEAGSLIYAGEE